MVSAQCIEIGTRFAIWLRNENPGVPNFLDSRQRGIYSKKRFLKVLESFLKNIFHS